MKKEDKNGFFLSETMVVIAVVSVVLLGVFKIFSHVYTNYKQEERYNTINAINALSNIKKYFDLAFNGETIVVSRKENKNVVVISEQEYNELQRAKRNAEYLAKLDRSFAQLKQGEVVIKSMEELERMADE